ncbi:MAG TPA: hypothetical protein VN622_15760 [Clostridia bacterium]|nr:hypothetical protein [Clostridia bacterium]
MSTSCAVSGIVGWLNSTTTKDGTTATTGGVMLDSVTGAVCELLTVQQGGASFALSSVPCCCAPSAIIGQSGGQCMGLAATGEQTPKESDGNNNAISTRLAETNLCQIRIVLTSEL